MSPKELYDSVRIKELERIRPFGLPLYVEMTIKLSEVDFENFGYGRRTIYSWHSEKVCVSLGRRLLLINEDSAKYRPTAIATVERAYAIEIRESPLLYMANRMSQRGEVPGEGLFSPQRRTVVSCYNISKINPRPSDVEINAVMRAMFGYNLTRHQKD